MIHIASEKPKAKAAAPSLRQRFDLHKMAAAFYAILTADQQAWISRSDTLYIASAHQETGADASHRGGEAGFVRGEGANRLALPDYSGNNMFNTLGNLAVDPRCGLLFIDGPSGSTLQLRGRATLLWDDPRIAAMPGAERLVEIEVEEVTETRNALPLRWV